MRSRIGARRSAFNGPAPGDPPDTRKPGAPRARGPIIGGLIDRGLMSPDQPPPPVPLAEPEERWRHLAPTTPDAHLVSMDALRIIEPRRTSGGDCHNSAQWHFRIRYDWPEEIAPTALKCPHTREVLEVLGTDRVVEVRSSFVNRNHHDADRDDSQRASTRSIRKRASRSISSWQPAHPTHSGSTGRRTSPTTK